MDVLLWTPATSWQGWTRTRSLWDWIRRSTRHIELTQIRRIIPDSFHWIFVVCAFEKLRKRRRCRNIVPWSWPRRELSIHFFWGWPPHFIQCRGSNWRRRGRHHCCFGSEIVHYKRTPDRATSRCSPHTCRDHECEKTLVQQQLFSCRRPLHSHLHSAVEQKMAVVYSKYPLHAPAPTEKYPPWITTMPLMTGTKKGCLLNDLSEDSVYSHWSCEIFIELHDHIVLGFPCLNSLLLPGSLFDDVDRHWQYP